jgi:glycosyltransferase involved in cell wall biosynthesis
MVSMEYPPMAGGIGRYSANLTNALRKSGIEVIVISDEKGNGDYKGISPKNKSTSEILLKFVTEIKPDIVHMQFEPGLYGWYINLLNPWNIKTNVDCFYDTCKTPIITTFHSAYTFHEWMGQVFYIRKTGKTGYIGIPARVLVKGWKNLVSYRPFIEFNKKKLKQSYAGICFSNYISNLLGGGLNIIYHGAEPSVYLPLTKEDAKQKFSIPLDKRIAVTVGFRTVTKGWDILDKVKLPDDWLIVSNSAKSHYNKESYYDRLDKDKVIDLQRGFLSEEELSVLLTASDAVLLPYRITSGSGVMFDALAHGLPFVATDLEFFKEFAKMDLGIATKRSPKSFEYALDMLDKNYYRYKNAVDNFKINIKWSSVADQHIKLYNNAIKH